MDDQIARGIGAGLVGGLVVLLIGMLKKPLRCPKCGFVFPKFGRPQSGKQALRGGRICPNCKSEIDRKGNIVASAESTGSSAESPRERVQSGNPQKTPDGLEKAGKVSLNARESAIRGNLSAIRERFSVLEKAYLCSSLGAGPKELADIDQALSGILSEGDIGLLFLLERLTAGITVSGNTISLYNWGEGAWNELLKKQTIIKAFGAAKAKGALPELEKLAKANCNYGQWRDCIKGPLDRAIAAIKSAQ